jgi:phosphonate transport system substrate-binding protein
VRKRYSFMKGFSTVFFLSLMILVNWALADSKELDKNVGKNTLLIGLVPERNIFSQIKLYKPITDYLSTKIGVKVNLKVMTRYGNIVDNFVPLGLDGAFFGSFSYVLAHRKIGVEVLARPEGLDGSSVYHGIIFVRRDSGIKNVRGMKGKRFAFVDEATTAGFLFPLVYFKKQGIQDYRTYFKEVYFAGTHKEAIYDVLNKRADIAAAKNTVYQALVGEKGKRARLELKILTRSADVPENALAMKKDLEPSIRRAFQEALLNMHNDPVGQALLKNFGARKFVTTTEEEYEPVIEFARELNLDLVHYNYMNN